MFIALIDSHMHQEVNFTAGQECYRTSFDAYAKRMNDCILTTQFLPFIKYHRIII